MQNVMDLRQRYKEEFATTHGVKLGFMSFFTKACVEALKEFPVINAYIEGDDIVYHNYFDIGIAVSTPRGLIVPVLHNADNLSFAGIELAIRTFAMRARDNKITIEELTGGTFTITQWRYIWFHAVHPYYQSATKCDNRYARYHVTPHC